MGSRTRTRRCRPPRRPRHHTAADARSRRHPRRSARIGVRGPLELVRERLAAAEQLVAAAHGKDHASALGDLPQRVLLGLDEIERATLLIAVLPAAEIEQIGLLGIEALAELAALELEPEATPAAALLE